MQYMTINCNILLVSQAYQIWLHISVLIFGSNLETNHLFGSRALRYPVMVLVRFVARR